MAKRNKQDLESFIKHLRHLMQTSEPQPFTTEEIELILKSCVKPKDLAKYRNDKLATIMEEAYAQQRAQAEANFRNPAQMHSLGELLDSTLIVKRIFISQLAQALDLTSEEIEDYIENRLPTRSWREDQIQKLAELTGIEIDEIRRIVSETAKADELKTRTTVEATPAHSPSKPRRPYPTTSGYSSVGMIRDGESENYGTDHEK
jgi:plasmid maintenance system antidote protein VapI